MPLVLNQKVLVIAGNQARVVPDYTLPPDITAAKSAGPVKSAEPSWTPTQAKPAEASEANETASQSRL